MPEVHTQLSDPTDILIALNDAMQNKQSVVAVVTIPHEDGARNYVCAMVKVGTDLRQTIMAFQATTESVIELMETKAQEEEQAGGMSKLIIDRLRKLMNDMKEKGGSNG